MKLPVQAAAVPRGLPGLPVSRSESAGVQPSSCGPGLFCCPSNTNCLRCCAISTQVCHNGACVNVG